MKATRRMEIIIVMIGLLVFAGVGFLTAEAMSYVVGKENMTNENALFNTLVAGVFGLWVGANVISFLRRGRL